jgi:hypothetical protein
VYMAEPWDHEDLWGARRRTRGWLLTWTDDPSPQIAE